MKKSSNLVKINILDVEKNLLALLLTKKGIFDEVLGVVSAEDFNNGTDLVHKQIFTMCQRCYERYRTVSVPGIISELRTFGITKAFGIDMDIGDYIQSLSVMPIRENDHMVLCNTLRDTSVRRRILISTDDIRNFLAKAPFSTPHETVKEVRRMFEDGMSFGNNYIERPRNVLEEMSLLRALEETKVQDERNAGYKGPHPTIQKIFGSLLRPGNITLLTSRSGVGKALANTERIPTANKGIVTIDKIEVGDTVYSKNDRETTVLGVYPQGKKECAEVIYEGNFLSTVASLDHLWSVKILDNKASIYHDATVTTKMILEGLEAGKEILVPTSPFISRRERYKYAPFYIGYSLGRFLQGNKDIMSHDWADVLDFFEDDFISIEANEIKIEELSPEMRMHLFIGYTHNNDKCKETKDSQFKRKISFQSKKDKQFFNKLALSIGIAVSEDDSSILFNCAALERFIRQGAVSQRFFDDYVQILQIKKSDTQECTCIMVDDESHLFQLENGILTHNTQFQMDFCSKVSSNYNIPVLHLDNGEMSERELQFRFLSKLGQINFFDIETGRWNKTKDGQEKVNRAVLSSKTRQYFYAQVAGMGFEEMRSIILNFFEYDCKGQPFIINFDYIKPPLDGSKEDEHKYIGRMLDKFKRLIHEEIKIDDRPLIPMMTSVQSNRKGVVANKKMSELDDSEEVFGLSDRLIHYASHAFIFRPNGVEEMAREGGRFGTHKLIGVKARHLGEDVHGYLDYVKTPEGFRKNSINLEIKNFDMKDRGDLRDVMAATTLEDVGIKKAKEDGKNEVPF